MLRLALQNCVLTQSISLNVLLSLKYVKGPLPLDNSERLLLREGVISELPPDLCTNAAGGKNVMLVIGDGMVSYEF
jgi:hypothetical protein